MGRFIPKSRMGIFTLALIAVLALKYLIPTVQPQYRLPYLSVLFDLCLLLLVIPAVYYILRIYAALRVRLLWKIKRRLVLANVFIGAIPVLTVVAIFWFAGLLSYYQLSYYLIVNQIGIHSAQIRAFTLSLQDRLQEAAEGVAAPSTLLKETLDSDAIFLLNSYPSAIISLHFKDPSTGREITYVNHGRNTGRMESYRLPAWIDGNTFSDLVVEDLQPDFYGGSVFLRSFTSSGFMSDLEFSLEVSVPLDHYFLNRLEDAFSMDVLLVDRTEVPRLNLLFQNINVPLEKIVDSTLDIKNSPGQAWSGWFFPLFPVSWAEGVEKDSFNLGILLVEPSVAKLLGNAFRSEGSIGKRILVILQVIVGFFLIVEIVSVLIGIRLTKSITAAIHNLDQGTEFVKRGDFRHKIAVQSEDQLGTLAASFNQMTEYIQQLVRERVLKERMERELEIAKEVQEQLFPNRSPRMKHLEVSGICLPARVVSGDYFDYLLLDSDVLGLAVGDICGKGISAALLMANLQATLRSNAMNIRQNGKLREDEAVAEIMQSTNRQMYEYTADNKFATLFYGVYNDATCMLTYCNAGHNRPLYFEGDRVLQLGTGGTVIGIFPDSRYDQATVKLNSGGILVAYTDGVTESVNEYGEEFGENRIIQLVQANRDLDADGLKSLIVEQVLSWTSAEERGDDMTLVVAKIHQTEEA
ncbi:MAG: PP2C family protein-serine/threonine phosphatase [Acidobacteria bacterium]|nr:PP2C family protein-serine/threonine phosphatase [Acidobacteriota bacterium]